MLNEVVSRSLIVQHSRNDNDSATAPSQSSSGNVSIGEEQRRRRQQHVYLVYTPSMRPESAPPSLPLYRLYQT